MEENLLPSSHEGLTLTERKKQFRRLALVFFPFVFISSCAWAILTPVLPNIKIDYFVKNCYRWQCTHNRTNPENVTLDQFDFDSNKTVLAEEWDERCLEGSIGTEHWDSCKGLAAAYSGDLDSAGAFLNVLTSVVYGRMSDSYGRKWFMVLAAVGSAFPVAFLVFFQDNLWYYLISKMCAGLMFSTNGGAGAIGIFCAYISDILAKEDRILGFASILGLAGLGVGVMPTITCHLYPNTITLTQLYWAAMSCSCFAVVYSIFLPEFRKENRPPFRCKDVCTLHVRSSATITSTNFVTSDKEVLSSIGQRQSFCQRNKLIITLCLVRFLSALPETGVIESALFYLQAKLHFTECQNATLFLSAGASLMVNQLVVIHFLKRYFSPNGILYIGLVSNLVHMFGYAVATSAGFMYVVEVFAGISFFAGAALLSVLSTSVPQSQQGVALGAMASVTGICSVIGPVLFTQLYNYFLKYNFPQFPFYVGAVMVGLAAVISLLFMPGDSCFKKKF